MNRDEWKNFLRWLETATNEELETRWLVLATIEITLREEGAKSWAKKALKEIRIELDARHSVR